MKPPQMLYRWQKPIPGLKIETKPEVEPVKNMEECPPLQIEPEDKHANGESQDSKDYIPKTPGSNIHNWDDHKNNPNFYN